MRRPQATPRTGEAVSLRAAARLARDENYSVRVVLADTAIDDRDLQLAGDEAGVDTVVLQTGGGQVIHFVARHADRLIGAWCRLARLVTAVHPKPIPEELSTDPSQLSLVTTPRGGVDAINLGIYRAILSDLRLTAADPQARGIAERLLRASPRAHICNGVPSLVVDDIGGLVRDIRVRATAYQSPVLVNSPDCACERSLIGSR